MIPLDKLRAIKHVVTHINCPDGVASAMILRDALPGVKLTFLMYNTKEHQALQPEEGMLFCDFSPHADHVQAFIDAGVIVLDHHKSQEGVVKAFGDLGVFADEKVEPGVCGATLAFREVWQPLMADTEDPATAEVERLATLAGIRDTWQRKDPRWLQACEQAESLFFWPLESLLVSPRQWADKLSLGSVLYERRLQRAQESLNNSFTFRSPKGRNVIIFDSLSTTSDASEMNPGDHDLVVGFGFKVEDHTRQKVVFSTRSKRGFNCAALGQAHGGGGHMSAAGFSVPLQEAVLQPFTLFEHLFILYEGVEEDWLSLVAAEAEAAKRNPERAKQFRPDRAYSELLEVKFLAADTLPPDHV